MGGVVYEFRFRTPGGAPLYTTQQVVSAEMTLVENDAGAVNVVIPEVKPFEFFRRDTRLEVWRGVDGGPLRLLGDTFYLLRKMRYKRTAAGAFLSLGGQDLKSILRSRFINSYAGSPRSRKSKACDDMMREIVRENLGTSAGVNESGVSRVVTGLTVETDSTRLPVMDKGFAWDTVLTTLQNLARASAEIGTYVSFDVFYDPLSALMQFRVFTGQRGVNRRAGAFNALALSPESGSISEVEVEDDYSEEITYCKAGGQGEGADRELGTYTDITRTNESPFNYREDFYNDSNIETNSVLVADAKSQVNKGRPLRNVKAKINQTSQVRFGVNYGWGDILTVNVKPNLSIGMRLSKLRIALDASTGETIDGLLESQTVIQ
jgi:hypothetical protein